MIFTKTIITALHTAKKGIIFLCAAILLSSMGIHRIDYREAINKNVCKSLKNEALVYFVFIDSKTTSPWTEFDIRSTLDSINVAVGWINKKALENNVSLRLRANYYIGKPYTTVNKNLTQGSIENTLKNGSLKNGFKELNLWADGIAKKVGSTFNIPEKDGIPEIKSPKNKERLLAYLRDENNVESVALVLMVNNYYRSDISLVVNRHKSDDIEFAIVSYKYPSEIAHNILALYGAAPMYKNIYRKNDKKILKLQKEFPNDVMLDPYGKDINRLDLGIYTKYLIGWTNNLDPKYDDLMTDGFLNF